MIEKEIFEGKGFKFIKQNDEIIFCSCQRCKKNSALADALTGEVFCYSCGYYYEVNGKSIDKKPVFSKKDLILSDDAKTWLSSFQVNGIENMGSGNHYYPELGWKQSLKFFCTENEKIKNIIGLRSDFDFFGSDHLDYVFNKSNLDLEIILVDHPIDYLVLLECGFKSVLFPPNPLTEDEHTLDFLKGIEPEIKKAKKIIFAFSESKLKYEDEVARRIGKEKCFRVRWESIDNYDNKFINEARALKTFVSYGNDFVRKTINEASPFPINGIYELSDVDSEFETLYTFGLQRGYSTGFPSLDDFYTIKPGQWTITTGIPNHGKSNFLDHLLVNMAALHNWKIGLFSPENQPIERHFVSLAEKFIGQGFMGRQKMSVEDKNSAKTFVQEHFKTILPEDDSNWSIDGILEFAKVLVYRYGIRGLLIDPWNELDHTRTSGMTETEHISRALTKIRRFARIYDVHVWIVAHPTKLYRDADGQYPVPTLYDINGGAHWRNKADNGIVIWRNVGAIDEDIVDIHIQKIRFKEVGRVGKISLRIEPYSGRCIDDINHEARAEAQLNTLKPSALVRLHNPRTTTNTQAAALPF